MPMLKRAASLLCLTLLFFLLAAQPSADNALADSQGLNRDETAPGTRVPLGEANKVEIVGTRFSITRSDGGLVTQAELIGTTINIEDAQGNTISIRIDDAELDPKDPNGEIMLYTLSVQDPATGSWRNMCSLDAQGVAKGFPLSGTWTRTGEHLQADKAYSLTCTSGALGKCVRMGYKPWATATDGSLLWDVHQACTRMVRADYCGDGKSHTRDGTLINIYDQLGIQKVESDSNTTFEAAWGPEGAVCVRKVRIPEDYSLQELERSCPRLKGKTGDACTEHQSLQSDDTLILNRS